MASENFISTVLDPSLDADIGTACNNLSDIIGDVNGKINKATAEAVMRGLQITANGTISIDLTEQIMSSSKWSSNIFQEQYLGEMSTRGTEIFYGIRNDDSNYVVFLSNSTKDFQITSPLILESDDLKTFLKNAIGAIFIELYALYLELLALTATGKIRSMNRTDLLVLDNNIWWMSNQLEAMSKPPYELIKALRFVQRTILYVKSMSKLFIDTYADLSMDVGGALNE